MTLLLAAAQPTRGDDLEWQLVGLAGTSIHTIAIDPQTPATIYAAVEGTILESHDAGRSWEETGYSGNAFSVLIDRATPSTLYARDAQGSVCRSVDTGKTWSDANAGLSGPVYGMSDGLYALESSGVSPTASPSPTPSPTPTPIGCAGDCDGSGDVGIGELVMLVRLALDDSSVICPAGDRNGDGMTRINEILAAVENSLDGCEHPGPSPTPVAAMGACYESSDCFPCDVYPCRPFAATRAFCCDLASTIQGATFSWCPAGAFDPSSLSCTQCAFPCE